jgi:sterol desaturase/sphingolipid hydroxylase (fatty acid hydroxylase superfamily)
MHILSCFFTPLIIYVFVSVMFNEKFLKNKETFYTSISQHAYQSLSGVSVWFFYSLFMKYPNQRIEIESTETCVLNLVAHFFMSDFLFYWCHRSLHIKELYFLHSQHHEHKVTKGAKVQMNALSGTCVHIMDMVIIGHLPIFLPCFVVSLPFAWMVAYVLFSNFWISAIHSTGTRVDDVPSLGGLLVTPRVHAGHHTYGRTNVNYGVFLTLWDRAMGTHQH